MKRYLEKIISTAHDGLSHRMLKITETTRTLSSVRLSVNVIGMQSNAVYVRQASEANRRG
jgi:hypothetical protein